MNRLLSPLVKYLSLALVGLFSVVSCAPQPQGRSIMHVYQKDSSLMAVSLFDLPQGTQVVAMSLGGVQGQAKRSISKSDFDSIWNRLHSEDLSRYRLQDQSAKFDTENNIVVKFGTLPAENIPNYVVPKKVASASLKAATASIKKLSPL